MSSLQKIRYWLRPKRELTEKQMDRFIAEIKLIQDREKSQQFMKPFNTYKSMPDESAGGIYAVGPYGLPARSEKLVKQWKLDDPKTVDRFQELRNEISRDNPELELLT